MKQLQISMERSPYWEANRSSASQYIPRTSLNLKVHYRIHKSQPPVPILRNITPVQAIPTNLFNINFNHFETDFFFQILAHPVFKMWVIQKPNKVALWNKRIFKRKKNGDYTACLKIQYRYLLNKYKMGHLEGNFMPVPYIGCKVPKG